MHVKLCNINVSMHTLWAANIRKYVRTYVRTELSIQTGCQRFHPKTQPPFLWASTNRGPHQHGRCAGRVSALESRLGWSMFQDWPPAKFGFLFGYTFWLSLRKITRSFWESSLRAAILTLGECFGRYRGRLNRASGSHVAGFSDFY